MKRSHADVYRAMNISRLAKPDLAELPLNFGGCTADRLDAEARIVAEGDDDIVVAVYMPECRVAGGYCDIPDAHEFIFKLWVMARLAADFSR